MKSGTQRNLRYGSMLPTVVAVAAGLLLLQALPSCVPGSFLDWQPAGTEGASDAYTAELGSERTLTPEELEQLVANASEQDVVVVFMNPVAGPPGPPGPPGPLGPSAVIGEVRMWAGPYDHLPPGWLPCDGRPISRATFAELFAVIGTAYGSGNNTTTFHLPDFRNRSPMGASQAGSSGQPFTTVSGSATPYGGAATHTLSVGEMPQHQHDMSHNHQVDVTTDITVGTQYLYTGLDNGGTVGTLNTSSSSATNTSSEGSSQPHNNLHPYFATTYMIFAGG